MDPLPQDVATQRTLRTHRESTRRFVQGAGALARVLGAKLRTASSGPSPLMAHFQSIEARSNDLDSSPSELFGYDFVKAILLWLESGIGRLIEGFTRPAEMIPSVRAAKRLPIPEAEASTEAVDEFLIPYLLRLAYDRPIVDLETNRFEVDENRQLFPSEKAAVLAFAAAVKIPFADLSSTVVLAEGEERIQAQDRETALKFWGLRVARGVLLNAAEGVNYVFVDKAFGGVGRVVRAMQAEEQDLEEVGGEEDERPVESVEVLNEEGRAVDGGHAEDVGAAMREVRESTAIGDDDQQEMMEEVEEMEESAVLAEEAEEGQSRQATNEREAVQANDDTEDDEDMIYYEDSDTDEATEDDEPSSDPDEEDGVPNLGLPRVMFTSAFERRRRKERVESSVPCTPYTRVYRGHCNVRTVKDVNFFGLEDEYVVSGSDDGNLFMWDRKTGEVVNVLEGDGEVVNVAQGHPFETMLAVSGIDHTVKIFSPDARARTAARLGHGVSAHDASTFSSIQWPLRAGRRVPRRSQRRSGTEGTAGIITSEPAVPGTSHEQAVLDEQEEDEDYIAPTGLASRKRMQDAYRIMNSNDVERQGGNNDTFITVRDLHPFLLMMLRRDGGLML